MTVVEAYTCDYCSQRFDDKDECILHERAHALTSLDGKVKLWDYDFRSLPLDNDVLENVYYIQCNTVEAAQLVNEWFEENGIEAAPYEYIHWTPDDIVYYHDCLDCWLSVNEQMIELENVKSKCK